MVMATTTTPIPPHQLMWIGSPQPPPLQIIIRTTRNIIALTTEDASVEIGVSPSAETDFVLVSFGLPSVLLPF